MTSVATAPLKHAAPVVPTRGALAPLGLGELEITGGFWGRRRDVNRSATLPHILHWLEREGWLGNFDLAATGRLPAGRRGREFADSEIYKFLEALAWDLGSAPDEDRENLFRSVVQRVAAAQEPDGYLNTCFGRPGQGARWSDLQWGHELYCLGHLFQAAVARARTRPGEEGGLLPVARRAADLVCEVFGESGLQFVCGHPEVEVGLAELARATGEKRYLRQAALFVERRGQGTLGEIGFGASYFQDDVPVRHASVLRGHAVRANYLAAGAVDVAVDTGDDELLQALRGQWRLTSARRTYITGGQGAHHQDEAFGTDWELPPDRAYSETCAGIGSIMFSWRLLLATGDAAYADLIERTLFNVLATAPASDGRSFFYSNTLHQRTAGVPADLEEASTRASGSMRAPWFAVSCCPPNVARTLASLPGYIATTSQDGLQIHQYAPADIHGTLQDGTSVDLRVETRYPGDGRVLVTVLSDAGGEWTLGLRVPSWAGGAVVRTTSSGTTSEREATPGMAEVRRRFRAGDTVDLQLPMEPRLTRPDRRIDAVRGCVAVERGPLVLCLESVDLPAEVTTAALNGVRLLSEHLEEHDGGVWVEVSVPDSDAADPTAAGQPWPYQSAPPPESATAFKVPLVAYHAWANRGPSTMRIWLPAIARQLERDALDDVLDRMEAEQGPVDEAAVEAMLGRLGSR